MAKAGHPGIIVTHDGAAGAESPTTDSRKFFRFRRGTRRAGRASWHTQQKRRWKLSAARCSGAANFRSKCWGHR